MELVLSLQMMETSPDLVADFAQSNGSSNSNTCSALSLSGCTITDRMF